MVKKPKFRFPHQKKEEGSDSNKSHGSDNDKKHNKKKLNTPPPQGNNSIGRPPRSPRRSPQPPPPPPPLSFQNDESIEVIATGSIGGLADLPALPRGATTTATATATTAKKRNMEVDKDHMEVLSIMSESSLESSISSKSSSSSRYNKKKKKKLSKKKKKLYEPSIPHPLVDFSRKQINILVLSGNMGNAKPDTKSIQAWIPFNGNCQEVLYNSKYPLQSAQEYLKETYTTNTKVPTLKKFLVEQQEHEEEMVKTHRNESGRITLDSLHNEPPSLRMTPSLTTFATETPPGPTLRKQINNNNNTTATSPLTATIPEDSAHVEPTFFHSRSGNSDAFAGINYTTSEEFTEEFTPEELSKDTKQFNHKNRSNETEIGQDSQFDIIVIGMQEATFENEEPAPAPQQPPPEQQLDSSVTSKSARALLNEFKDNNVVIEESPVSPLLSESELPLLANTSTSTNYNYSTDTTTFSVSDAIMIDETPQKPASSGRLLKKGIKNVGKTVNSVNKTVGKTVDRSYKTAKALNTYASSTDHVKKDLKNSSKRNSNNSQVHSPNGMSENNLSTIINNNNNDNNGFDSQNATSSSMNKNNDNSTQRTRQPTIIHHSLQSANSQHDVTSSKKELSDTQILHGLFQQQLPSYTKAISYQRGEMRLVVYYLHTNIQMDVLSVQAQNTGVAGLANKGGIVAEVCVNQSTRLAFLSAHLEAHEGKQKYQMRCSSLADILRGTESKYTAHRCDASLASHYMFCLGDLNFRTRLPNFEPGSQEHIQQAHALAETKHGWQTLNDHDELKSALELKDCLVGFHTPPCQFPPTFKVLRQIGYKYNEKRSPSYTDRILYKGNDQLESSVHPLVYEPIDDFSSSDHKPIRGAFSMQLNDKLKWRPILGERSPHALRLGSRGNSGFSFGSGRNSSSEINNSNNEVKRESLHIFVSNIKCLINPKTYKKDSPPSPYVSFLSTPLTAVVHQEFSKWSIMKKRINLTTKRFLRKKKKSDESDQNTNKGDRTNLFGWPRTRKLSSTYDADWGREEVHFEVKTHDTAGTPIDLTGAMLHVTVLDGKGQAEGYTVGSFTMNLAKLISLTRQPKKRSDSEMHDDDDNDNNRDQFNDDPTCTGESFHDHTQKSNTNLHDSLSLLFNDHGTLSPNTASDASRAFKVGPSDHLRTAFHRPSFATSAARRTMKSSIAEKMRHHPSNESFMEGGAFFGHGTAPPPPFPPPLPLKKAQSEVVVPKVPPPTKLKRIETLPVGQQGKQIITTTKKNIISSPGTTEPKISNDRPQDTTTVQTPPRRRSLSAPTSPSNNNRKTPLDLWNKAMSAVKHDHHHHYDYDHSSKGGGGVPPPSPTGSSDFRFGKKRMFSASSANGTMPRRPSGAWKNTIALALGSLHNHHHSHHFGTSDKDELDELNICSLTLDEPILKNGKEIGRIKCTIDAWWSDEDRTSVFQQWTQWGPAKHRHHHNHYQNDDNDNSADDNNNKHNETEPNFETTRDDNDSFMHDPKNRKQW